MDVAVDLSCLVPDRPVGAVAGSYADQKLGGLLFRGGHLRLRG
jgi:hypothetical protein